MTRRLLGYVLKRPDGTRSGIVGADPIHDMTLSREDRTACYWVPVFAVRKPKPAKSARISADEWNAKHPIGTRVRYWSLRPTVSGDAPPIETKTRSTAWALGSGDAVVSVDGVAGGVALTHVDVLDEPAPPVAEAEGRYAVLQDGGTPAGFFPMRECPMDSDTTSTRDEAIGRVARMRATDTRRSTYEVMRILPDGAHEAAIAAAREEGRREGWLEAVTMLREGLTAEREDAKADMDNRDTESHEAGYVAGVTWAIAQINEAVREAAKGAAK
jgi:hypothetical protein